MQLTEGPKQRSHKRRFTPLGVVFTIVGLVLFWYFVKRAGVGQIAEGIKKLGAGFLAVLAISSLRQVVRSWSWMLCFDGPERLSFWDAFRARVMGDAIGNVVPFASMVISEPAKPALVRDRVPLAAGFSAIAIENILYGLSVAIFVFSGVTALLLSFTLPKGLRIASICTLAFIPLLIAVGYLCIRRQWRFISAPVGFFERRGFSKRWHESGRALEDRIYGFYQHNSSRFLPILLLEACFHLSGVLEIFVTLSFITPGRPPTFFTAFILESVNRIINIAFKFIPLRLGVDEAGTGKVASALQFTEATGVTLAIVRKGRDIFWTSVGAGLLIQRGLSLRAVARNAEEAIAAQAADTPAAMAGARPNESS